MRTWESRTSMAADGEPPHSTRAGLPLSVGQAPLPVRLLIAFVFLVAASLCIAGGRMISTALPAQVVAIVLIVPIGLIGVLAAAFVIAPRSRFGDRLDRFVPRLREPRIAVATAIVLWLLAAAATM